MARSEARCSESGLADPHGGLSPALVGAEPLALLVSPVFEVAFGYRGKLPFLEFGYNAASHQFGFSDGGGDLPSDPNLWSWFLWSRHCCLKANIPPFTGGSRQELKGPPLLLQRGAP